MTAAASDDPVILFTAFEPSGDEHAAPVIAALRRQRPGLRIAAMGGPRMEAAGAAMIEMTTERSVMGAGAAGQAMAHRRRLKRLKQWVDANPVAVHVPTDSPAANWAICRMVKKRWGGTTMGTSKGGRVVHLVAPQVWAWASWRVRRLRRLSDHVLCLLPFEPAWFDRHGVAATFIGHPLFDAPLPAVDESAAEQTGGPRLALLPGSRQAEVARNWPIMRQVAEQLAERLPGLSAVVAAADASAERVVRASLEQRPAAAVTVQRGGMDHVVAGSDAVLSVSGTATLHVARRLKPMVVIYRAGAFAWHAVGRWLMNTGTFTLPNLVAGGGPHHDPQRHVVPEFVPLLSAGPPQINMIADALVPLLTDTPQRERQVDDLRKVVAAFEGHDAGQEAAAVILKVMQGRDRGAEAAQS